MTFEKLLLRSSYKNLYNLKPRVMSGREASAQRTMPNTIHYP